MVKDFTITAHNLNITAKAVLLLAVCLLPAVKVAAAEQAATKAVPSNEIKNEKPDESIITLDEFASRVEAGLKTKVLVGQNLTDAKVHININREALNYAQFLTQLNANGFTAYKSKDYIVIIMNRDARSMPIPVADKRSSYADDEYITDHIKVEKACVNDVLAAMRPLVPQYGHMTSIESARTLLIVDTFSNIQRIKAMVKTIEENIDTKQNCSPRDNPEPQILKNPAIK